MTSPIGNQIKHLAVPSHLGRESARRIRRILSSLLTDAPFFGAMALRMETEPGGKETKTISADGETIRFNPKWVDEGQVDDIKETLAHVILACGLKHHLRREGRNQERWNQASRLVTLPLLREARLAVSPGGMEVPVEEAYNLIPELQDGDGSPDENGPPDTGEVLDFPGLGGGSGDGGEGEGDSPRNQPGKGTGNAPGGGKGKDPDAGGSGDGEGQEDAPEGEGEGEGEGSGEGDGGSGASGGEPPSMEAREALQNESEKWDTALAQARQLMATQRSIGIGRDPAGLEGLLDRYTRGKVDWKSLLRSFLIQRAKDDYSWSRPNHRFLHAGLYLPSRHSERAGPIVFAVDTSGSMGGPEEKLLQQVWGEIRLAAEETNPEEVRIIQCDAAVQSDERFDTVTELPERIQIRGGGGTRFAPVFERLAEDALGGDGATTQAPACLIFFSDLECWDFGEEPDCPVVWACFTEESRIRKPPFGEVIPIPLDRETA